MCSEILDNTLNMNLHMFSELLVKLTVRVLVYAGVH